MNPPLHIRPMHLNDLRLALSWAESEGWNPYTSDATSFYTADPEGFFIGEIDGEPVGCPHNPNPNLAQLPRNPPLSLKKH